MQELTKELSSLRKKLPRSYARKIAEKLDGVEEWHVRYVFTGREVLPEIFSRIVNQANYLVLQEDRKKKKMKKAIKKTLRSVAPSLALFFLPIAKLFA